jgi:hypothetical protein
VEGEEEPGRTNDKEELGQTNLMIAEKAVNERERERERPHDRREDSQRACRQLSLPPRARKELFASSAGTCVPCRERGLGFRV